MMKNIVESIAELEVILSANQPLAVAFSGGIDSSFLTYCAFRVLKNNMLAVTVITPFSIKAELYRAQQFAKRYGFRHEVVNIDILQNEDVVRNDAMRCYFCKKLMFEKICSFVKEMGFYHIADGSSKSDSSDYRPGKKALSECGILSPLESAGFTRERIIEGCHYLHLQFDTTSPNSCLATRVPYGEIITDGMLRKIEKAENILLELGLGPLRVRSHGHIARIEFIHEKMQCVMSDDSLRKKVIRAVKESGFHYVTIDMEGLRIGSMNEALGLQT
jgi:uncharacterized protein